MYLKNKFFHDRNKIEIEYENESDDQKCKINNLNKVEEGSLANKIAAEYSFDSLDSLSRPLLNKTKKIDIEETIIKIMKNDDNNNDNDNNNINNMNNNDINDKNISCFLTFEALHVLHFMMTSHDQKVKETKIAGDQVRKSSFIAMLLFNRFLLIQDLNKIK